MPATARQQREAVNDAHDRSVVDGIIAGLLAPEKRIDSRFFYDETGSLLFEQITGVPEYYPTRTELELLHANRESIAAVLGRGQVLIEPGAGNCSKVRTILPTLRPACFVPIDISGEFLAAAARDLQAAFPEIRVLPMVADMGATVKLPAEFDSLSCNVFYPGSTIGNYEPANAQEFLRQMRTVIGPRGGLLIGVDLQKDARILNAAYNDSQGVTARFNLNILRHVNRLAEADFDSDRFRHVAFYNEAEGRIEMHLESISEQRVTISGIEIPLRAGERILTEYSYKYTREGFAGLAAAAGLVAGDYWMDDQGLFSLQHFRSGAGH